MKDKNFEIWKNIYENFYKTPLKYTTEEQETSEKEQREIYKTEKREIYKTEEQEVAT